MIRWLLLACLVATPVLAAGSDPYEALKAMDGHWTGTTATGRIQQIDNDCRRAGLWFVCDQSVGGKPAALVIFQPTGHGEGKLTYRVETLGSGGDRPGPRQELAIDGSTWTITDAAGVGRRRTRTVVTHSGPDAMHAETQAEGKDDTWITLTSESFARR
jgi:hypothetical protein